MTTDEQQTLKELDEMRESNNYHYDKRIEVSRELEALRQILEGLNNWTIALQRKNADYNIHRVDRDS